MNKIKEITDYLSSTKLNNDELILELENYENAILEEIRPFISQSDLNPKNIREYVEQIAKTNNLINKKEYVDLVESLSKLSGTIKSLKRGKIGEKDVDNALRRLQFIGDYRILSNIEIHDEFEETELDKVIICKKGIIVIEVKNYNRQMTLTKEGYFVETDCKYDKPYNLACKMNTKETLVRKLVNEELKNLGKKINLNYYGIVLCSNRKSNVIDEYNLIPICYCSNIVDYIINLKPSQYPKLSDNDVVTLEMIMKKIHNPQKHLCSINVHKTTKMLERFIDLINHKEVKKVVFLPGIKCYVKENGILHKLYVADMKVFAKLAKTSLNNI